MFRVHVILNNGNTEQYKGKRQLILRASAVALLVGILSAHESRAGILGPGTSAKPPAPPSDGAKPLQQVFLPPPGGSGSGSEQPTNAPEEIVVTARQRKEKAQEV